MVLTSKMQELFQYYYYKNECKNENAVIMSALCMKHKQLNCISHETGNCQPCNFNFRHMLINYIVVHIVNIELNVQLSVQY